MPERYKNVEFGKLSDFITPDKFRTIDEGTRRIPMGVTEFAVEIQLKKNMRKKLSFKTPWDGIIYGCARSKQELKDKLGLESDIKMAYIVDWDDKFLIMLELSNSKEKPIVYVSGSDVAELLENCIRIPEQRDNYERID